MGLLAVDLPNAAKPPGEGIKGGFTAREYIPNTWYSWMYLRGKKVSGPRSFIAGVPINPHSTCTSKSMSEPSSKGGYVDHTILVADSRC